MGGLLAVGVVGLGGWLFWPQILAWLGQHGGHGAAGPFVSGSPGSSTSNAQTTAPAVTDPNLTAHATTWRTARIQNGQDPNNWQAFRQFEIGIRAPDPGPTPVAGWPNAFGGSGLGGVSGGGY